MRTHTGWGGSELVHKALCSLCVNSDSGEERGHSFSCRECPVCLPGPQVSHSNSGPEPQVDCFQMVSPLPLMLCPCSGGGANSSPPLPIAARPPLCPALHNWLPARCVGSGLAHPVLCLLSTLISQAAWGTTPHFPLEE